MCLVHQVLPTSTGCSRVVTHLGTNPRSTVLDFGDLTGTGMSPPLGRREVTLTSVNILCHNQNFRMNLIKRTMSSLFLSLLAGSES